MTETTAAVPADKYMIPVLDLETAGTDERTNPILEIGIVLLDYDLSELESLELVVQPEGSLDDLIASLHPKVREMHEANGLLDDLRDGRGVPIEEAEKAAISMLASNGNKHDFVLGGSGVAHFDRRFIQAQMPKLDKWFRYYVLDVGVMRRFAQLFDRNDLTLELEGDKQHRALADALWHAEEIRHLKAALQGGAR